MKILDYRKHILNALDITTTIHYVDGSNIPKEAEACIEQAHKQLDNAYNLLNQHIGERVNDAGIFEGQ